VPSLSDDLLFRGLLSQQTAGLTAVIDGGRLTVYHGVDPTADSLHAGHLIGLVTLRRLQQAGHRPIVLAGGATGLIGDPGGRDIERPLLDMSEVEANVAGQLRQIEQLLDFSGPGGSNAATLVNNADWLVPFSLVEFLRDVGKHFTVNQMVAKESVRTRIERPDQGISFTEFSYMLLQAADFLHLHDAFGCDMQVGGSDQWGNITMGVELIRKARGHEAHGLCWPLLTRSDGTKIGKSDAGAVPWLDGKRTSPFGLYQYFVRKPDDEVSQLLRYYTFLSHEEISALDLETSEHPERRSAQRTLARCVCTMVHGEAEAARAERAAKALYSEEIASLEEPLLLEVFAEAPSSLLARSLIDGEGLDLVEALTLTDLSASRASARTVIEQGGAYVNNRRAPVGGRISASDLLHDRYVVVRKGRRDYHLISFK
jgi:tyrosyl-tRNA synthetase